MITIQIKDNTPTGITLQADGVSISNVVDLTFNCEGNNYSDLTCLATVVHTASANGKAIAQILKDHGFQVRVLDYEELDKHGNPFEYML